MHVGLKSHQWEVLTKDTVAEETNILRKNHKGVGNVSINLIPKLIIGNLTMTKLIVR